jgi:hypothetical protein
VTPTGDPPNAVNDTETTAEDTAVDIAVLSNDSDPDGNPLTLISVNFQGSRGTVAINPDSTVRYTPNLNINGTDTFTYTISDGNGGTDTATVTVNIGINDPPEAVNDSKTTNEDGVLVIEVDELLGNDRDVDGDAFTLTAVGGAVNGKVEWLGGDLVFFTPATNFNGLASFTYTITDGALTDTAMVNVTVTPVNDPPSFTRGSDQAVVEDAGPQTVPSWATNISPGPPDESAQKTTFEVRTIIGNPNLFTIPPVIGEDGTLTYIPAPNATGFADIILVLTDNGGTANGGVDTSAQQEFRITVLPDADADSVPDAVENGAPNGGDGNKDGTLDSQQKDVTSRPDAVTGKYVTVVAHSTLKTVEAIKGPPVEAPENASFPIGLLDFTVEGVPPGGATTVDILLETGALLNSYFMVGREPNNPVEHVYEFLFDGTTGAELFDDNKDGLTERIVLHVQDGGRGDDDLTPNGEIEDPGGPAFLATLDIDGNGRLEPASDGKLIFRHLGGYPDSHLISGIVFDSASTRKTPTAVRQYLNLAGLSVLDADGDGVAKAFTDGRLFERYLANADDATLLNGSVLGTNATRRTATAIRQFLDQFRPVPTPAPQTASAAETSSVIGQSSLGSESGAISYQPSAISSSSNSALSAETSSVIGQSSTVDPNSEFSIQNSTFVQGGALAYVQQSWVKDFVTNPSAFEATDEDELVVTQ